MEDAPMLERDDGQVLVQNPGGHAYQPTIAEVNGAQELRKLSARIVAEAVADVRLAAISSINDLTASLRASMEDHGGRAQSVNSPFGGSRTHVPTLDGELPPQPSHSSWKSPGQLMRLSDDLQPLEDEALDNAPPTTAQLAGDNHQAANNDDVSAVQQTANSEQKAKRGLTGKIWNSLRGEAHEVMDEAANLERAAVGGAREVMQEVADMSHHAKHLLDRCKSQHIEETTSVQKHEKSWVGEAYKNANRSSKREIEARLATTDNRKRWAMAVVTAPVFNYTVCLIIFINSITIGYEIDLGLKGEASEFLTTVEHVFLVIYILELALTFYACGFSVLKGSNSGAIRLDCLLVAVGICTSWILVPIMSTSASEEDNGDVSLVSFLEQIMIFRMLRILRLARALRLLGYFDTLAKFVDGMVSSFGTMFSALVIMFLVLYILACLAAELISKSNLLLQDRVGRRIVEAHFTSLPQIMMTLFQFTTGDSLASIYFPLVELEPTLAVFFLVCFVVVTILLMNLVAAIVLEDALYRATKDKEKEIALMRRKIKMYRPWLQVIFEEMDQSSDGTLELVEVTESIGLMARHPDIPSELADVLHPERMIDFFEHLDLDGSGTISKEEFVDGVTHLALNAVPVETSQMLQLLRAERHQLLGLETNMERVHRCLEYVIDHKGSVSFCPWLAGHGTSAADST